MKAIVMVRNGSAMPGPNCLLTPPREGNPEMDGCMHEFRVWREKKRWCVCVCPCAWTHLHAHPHHLKSLFPLVSSGMAALVMSAVPAPL